MSFKSFDFIFYPFNPETTIIFELRAAGFVELSVYDVGGREIARLVDGYKATGMHEVTFDGSELPSGIYFACLKVDDFRHNRKMVLIK